MSRRYLRIWYVNEFGQEIDCSPLCSAILPRCKVPLHRRVAAEYIGACHRPRRELGVTLLFNELKRNRPLFRGIIIVACPDRRVMAARGKRARTPGIKVHLTPYNSYVGSFCAIAQTGQVVAGDLCEPTLGTAYRTGLRLVRDVLTRKPGQLSARSM